MRELPRGWASATVGEIATLADGPFGSNLKTSHYVDEGPRVVRLQNIGDGLFNDERAYITVGHFGQLARHHVQPGDIVVASLGENPPRACLVPQWLGPALVKADCIRARPAEGVEPAYLMWILNSPPVRAQAAIRVKGVGRPRLGLGGIRQLQVPVPPLNEQRRIVAAIEEQLSRLDAADASLSAATRRLQGLRRKVADLVCQVNGRRALLGDIAQVQGGIQKQPKRRPMENAYPFLRVANVLRGRLDLSEVHEIELFEGELGRLALRAGDLLVVEGNGSVEQIGRSALWRAEIDPCVHQNHLIRVRPGESLDPEFLALYWNAPSTASRIAAVASSTSGLYTLSASKLRNVEITFPALTEQRNIAEHVEERLAAVGTMLESIERAHRRSASLRRSILERAFRGELVSQDPSDEPASVLLERIRTKRATSEPATGRRRSAVRP